MARRSRRERSARRSMPRPSPTIRPACIWCRACCSRCCSGRRPAGGSSSTCRCSNSMLAAQMQEAATQMMRGHELNWGAMPLSGVFETTDGALVMVGAFKADPAEGHRHGARHRGPRGRSALRRRMRCACRTSRRCRRCSASASRPTRRRTGSRKLEEQDLLCAPVRTLAEALADEQTTINGMILRGAGRGRDREASSARRSTCRTRR